MPSGAYYNEIDPYAAQWLRNLIAAGHIAPGDVDDRSLLDVSPADLHGYAQCHFFAGIGVWSVALRRAGWSDDRPVWTGSCPCQPFSVAGMGRGFDDERHLWPYWHWLIEQCRPAIVLGEQVASKDADPWIDLVQADMEGMAYAFGAVPFPSAGVGAPHVRDRLYWVAHADDAGLEGRGGVRERAVERAAGSRGVAGRLADAQRHVGGRKAESSNHIGQETDGPTNRLGGRGSASGRLADANGSLSGQGGEIYGRRNPGSDAQPRAGLGGGDLPTGPTNGYWRDADWLFCRDGKWRPVEPGTFPLAHGAPARVGRLRAYGNAINAIQAQVFVEEVMECLP